MVIIIEKEKILHFKYFIWKKGPHMNHLIKIFRKIGTLVLKFLTYLEK